MRAALKLITIAAFAAAASACHKQDAQAQNQNLGIDESGMSNGLPANADVETLPPDESSETPSNELANGSDNPDVNDVNSSEDAE
jgi:ABC-type uncharacterized transport system auxiliary subunit